MQGEKKRKKQQQQKTQSTAIRLSVIIDIFIWETNHTVTKFIQTDGERTIHLVRSRLP